MINTMQKTCCALAIFAATSLPALAESVDVRVTGTITPTACVPALSGGGVVDYGVIDPSTLSDTAYTVLPAKQLAFAISCDAPAKLGIRALNGRTGSLAGATEQFGGVGAAPVTLLGVASSPAVGLGLDGSAKIGGYSMYMADDALADGVRVDGIHRNVPTTGNNWLKQTGSIYSNLAERNLSWAATGTTTPVAFTTLSGNFNIQAYLNKASELDLTKPVTLDGLSTIELIYL